MTVQFPAQAPSTSPVAGSPVPGQNAPATAAEMYEALRAQVTVIEEQLSDAQRVREEIARRLRSSELVTVDRTGLEGRLVQVDARIAQLDAQLNTASAQLSNAAAQPGAVVERPVDHTDDVLEVAAIFSVLFLFVAVLPISVAWARRIWKKNSVTINLPVELTARLEQIERGVDATALEIERIGEGQRFVTQLLAGADRTKQTALPPREGTGPR